MEFLGLTIDNISRHALYRRIGSILDGNRFSHVVTINPEFVVESHANPAFRRILRDAQLREIDGVGVALGMLFRGARAKHRLAGADLVESILSGANKRNMRVFLVANRYGLSTWQETAHALRDRYPNIRFSGVNSDPKDIVSLVRQQEVAKSNVILVGTGAPFQEYMIDAMKHFNPGNIRLAIGLGGTFDFITQKVQRAPKWVRRIGFEWLWRVIEQPRRLKREVRKFVLYPLLLIFRELPPPFMKWLSVPEYRTISKLIR